MFSVRHGIKHSGWKEENTNKHLLAPVKFSKLSLILIFFPLLLLTRQEAKVSFVLASPFSKQRQWHRSSSVIFFVHRIVFSSFVRSFITRLRRRRRWRRLACPFVRSTFFHYGTTTTYLVPSSLVYPTHSSIAFPFKPPR